MTPITLEFLTQRKAAILNDLKFKVEAEDWHGVQDCASDIREIEAQQTVLEDYTLSTSPPYRIEFGHGMPTK